LAVGRMFYQPLSQAHGGWAMAQVGANL